MTEVVKILKRLDTMTEITRRGNGNLILKPRADLEFYTLNEPIQEFSSDIKVLYNNSYELVYSIANLDYIITKVNYHNTRIYEIKLRQILLEDRICKEA